MASHISQSLRGVTKLNFILTVCVQISFVHMFVLSWVEMMYLNMGYLCAPEDKFKSLYALKTRIITAYEEVTKKIKNIKNNPLNLKPSHGFFLNPHSTFKVKSNSKKREIVCLRLAAKNLFEKQQPKTCFCNTFCSFS